VPVIEGIGHPSVMTYADLLSGRRDAGDRVAVIGAGGVGVDVCHALTDEIDDLAQWRVRWGVADPAVHRGGLRPKQPPTPRREVWLVQRRSGQIGGGLGKTSGWVHRLNLRDAGVHQVSGATYRSIDDAGLHLTVDGHEQTLAVDSIVLCAGQESVRDLVDVVPRPHVIGGAALAAELDAVRAIRQGVELAARL